MAADPHDADGGDGGGGGGAWVSFDVGFIPQRSVCAAHPDWRRMAVRRRPFFHPSLDLRHLPAPPALGEGANAAAAPRSLLYAPFVQMRLNRGLNTVVVAAAVTVAATAAIGIASTTATESAEAAATAVAGDLATPSVCLMNTPRANLSPPLRLPP